MKLAPDQFDATIDGLIDHLIQSSDSLERIERKINESTNFIESTVKLADGLRITSTISYSSVYGVPEIHLRLTLNEQLLFDPEATQHALSGITSSNSAFEPLIASITLKEHRFLGSTWFYIHPCDSGAFMDEAYTGDDSLQWLVLWASIYGRLAGL